jgi:NAD(P)-dependent dehydrogenase (short-subunit alcohol dehydrogenase family)
MRMGIVVVTGASSGLGAEMARQFADRGWDLALCARRTDPLDALADEVRSATGRRVETAALDVTDPGAVAAVFGRFDEAFGGGPATASSPRWPSTTAPSSSRVCTRTTSRCWSRRGGESPGGARGAVGA